MMRWPLGLTLLISPALVLAQPQESLRQEIQTVIKQGRGNAAGRAAWERLGQRGPEALVPLLEAMNGLDTSAANWLRTAFDQIAERALKQDPKKLEVDALLAFVKDGKKAGRARRLALDLVDQVRPGTASALYPLWLDDSEFRFDAVARMLDLARTKAKQGSPDQAKTLFAQAFASARDVQQARDAAVGLTSVKESAPSVGRHLGFLMDWHLIGPFDGQGQKGFQLMYPPEKVVNLQAELAGQGGRQLRWKQYTVQEPALTSGARHQALVNLRDKDALGDADDAVAFAYAEFAVDKAMAVEFRGAADDNFTVYVNGARAFGFEEYRNGVRHDRHRFKVNLRAGKNTVLVKICQSAAPNPEPNWEFFLRVVDDTGKGIAMKKLGS